MVKQFLISSSDIDNSTSNRFSSQFAHTTRSTHTHIHTPNSHLIYCLLFRESSKANIGQQIAFCQILIHPDAKAPTSSSVCCFTFSFSICSFWPICWICLWLFVENGRTVANVANELAAQCIVTEQPASYRLNRVTISRVC